MSSLVRDRKLRLLVSHRHQQDGSIDTGLCVGGRRSGAQNGARRAAGPTTQSVSASALDNFKLELEKRIEKWEPPRFLWRAAATLLLVRHARPRQVLSSRFSTITAKLAGRSNNTWHAAASRLLFILERARCRLHATVVSIPVPMMIAAPFRPSLHSTQAGQVTQRVLRGKIHFANTQARHALTAARLYAAAAPEGRARGYLTVAARRDAVAESTHVFFSIHASRIK